MHEWTGNDLTEKKLSPGILAICAHNRLPETIDVASCGHPYHAFLSAFRTFNREFYDLCRPVLHKKDPPINASAATAFCLGPKQYATHAGRLFLSGDSCVLAMCGGRHWGLEMSPMRLFQGCRDFLLILASLRDRF